MVSAQFIYIIIIINITIITLIKTPKMSKCTEIKEKWNKNINHVSTQSSGQEKEKKNFIAIEK